MYTATPFTRHNTPMFNPGSFYTREGLDRYLKDTLRTETIYGIRQTVAYFHVFVDGQLRELHITRYGRERGLRNWQTAPEGADLDSLLVTGHPADDAPYTWDCNRTIYLLQGEGEPFTITGPWPNKCLCSATRMGRDTWRVQPIGGSYTIHYGITKRDDVIALMKEISK